MAKKMDGQQVLEETTGNAKEIEKILNEIFDMVAPDRKAEAERKITVLEKKMFYQDYLYDIHGSIAEGGTADVLSFDEVNEKLLIVGWLS